MNSRERVRVALTGRVPDRIPFCFGFFHQSFPGIPDVDEHFGADVRFVRLSPPAEQGDFLGYLRGLPSDIHVGSLDQLQTYFEWGYRPEAAARNPLQGVRDLSGLAEARLPDLTDPARFRGLTDQVRRWHDRGLAVAASPPHLGGELFETAWRLRGFETFMLDLLERPEIVGYLLDQLTAMLVHNVLILARAGVDILLLDDDVAMPTGLMISPALWRRYFKPCFAETIRLARSVASDLLVFYHSDGDFTRLIPDLVEIGVDVINPVQPDCMDAAAIRRHLGARPALWGTVGSASFWDHGTPDQVQSQVRHRIDELGPAGLLLAPAYDVDYTPLANLEAFAAAVVQG